MQECVDRDWWEPGPESPHTGFHCLLPPESDRTETSGTSWLHECECVISLALASTKPNPPPPQKRLFPKIRNPTEAINKRNQRREITMHGLCGVSCDWLAGLFGATSGSQSWTCCDICVHIWFVGSSTTQSLLPKRDAQFTLSFTDSTVRYSITYYIWESSSDDIEHQQFIAHRGEGVG